MSNVYLVGIGTQQLTDVDAQRLSRALQKNTTFNGALYLSNNALTDQVPV